MISFQIHSKSDVQSIISQVKKFSSNNCNHDIIITELITIVSEIVYNIIKYSPSGNLKLYIKNKNFIIEANDIGHGFAERLELSLHEGYSTSGTLGLGIPSLIRMCDEFDLSTSNSGTKIVCKKDYN